MHKRPMAHGSALIWAAACVATAISSEVFGSPLVSLAFNEGSGTSAGSTGTLSVSSVFSGTNDQPTSSLWGGSGTGVSGRITDNSFSTLSASGMGTQQSGPHLSVAFPQDAPTPTSLTITGWTKPTVADLARAQILAFTLPGGGTLELNGLGGGPLGASSRLRLIGLGLDVASDYESAYSTPNTWGFFAVTYAMSGTIQTARFYEGTREVVTGVSKVSTSSPMITFSSWPSGGLSLPLVDSTLTIGSRPSYRDPFQGLVDDIRIYGSALPQSDIEVIRLQAVPEPSTCSMALAGIAFGGYSMWRRRKRVERLRRSLVAASLVLMAVFLASGPADAGPISIEWVTVGNPWNANDTTGYGAVSEEYRIMKFEFTNSQYAAFLNAVDPAGTNPNAIYVTQMGGSARGGISFTSGNVAGNKYAVLSSKGDKPVNDVSWWNAARVSNWLHNGAQTYGSTDSLASAPQNTGAYTVGTATSGTAPAKSEGAHYWIPTENEWYKAAYYNPTLNNNTGGYHVYGNGFDATPGIVSANGTGDGSAGNTGNFANYNSGADWNGLDGNVTTVGTNGGASFYGAFDMSGNVWEWNDLTGAASSTRGYRGGVWFDSGSGLSSSYRSYGVDPSYVKATISGFRLASPVAVPEPSTWVMGLAGLACGGYSMFRRRKRA